MSVRTYQIRELYFPGEPEAAALETAVNGRDGIRTPSTGSVRWSTTPLAKRSVRPTCKEPVECFASERWRQPEKPEGLLATGD